MNYQLSIINCSYRSELVEEDEEDEEGTDEAEGEEDEGEKALGDTAVVGELAAHDVFGHVPTDEEAGEEGAGRQQVLGGEVVAEVEDVKAEELQLWHGAHRQRAHDGDGGADGGEHPCGTRATGVQLFGEEGGADLVHGDGAGEGREDQKGVEKDGDDAADEWYRAEGLLEDVGQGDEDERRTGVGRHADGEGGGEDHQAGEDGDGAVEERDLEC